MVTAEDGTTTKTYTLTITKAQPSNNATLSLLTISQGTLSPKFSQNTITYKASVPNSTQSIRVTPTVTNLFATVKVNNQGVSLGAGQIVLLKMGINTVKVLVTAENKTTTKTYTLTITKKK